MFGFVKELVAHWPQPTWGLLGAYAALVLVLPVRLMDYSGANRRPSAGGVPLQDAELQARSMIATVPAADVPPAADCVVEVVEVVAPVAVVAVQAAAGKLRIHRPKPGLKARPLQAFRQAPLKAKRSKPSNKRSTYNARNSANPAKRAAPQTRIIKQPAQRATVKRVIGNVVQFPRARTRPIASASLKRAA